MDEILKIIEENPHLVHELPADESYLLNLYAYHELTQPDLYFKIKPYKDTRQINHRTRDFHIAFVPTNEHSNDETRLPVTDEGMVKHFKAWFKLIERYSDLITRWNKVLVSHADYFEAQFKMTDHDADAVPFQAPQILSLNTYLEQQQAYLEKVKKEEKTPKKIEDIIVEIDDIKENLASTPKNKVVRRIGIVYAKIITTLKRHSIDFIKKFSSGLQKEATKGLIEFVKEVGKDLLDT